MHFQDRGLYGRINHLQPVRWDEGWPIMGQDKNDDGIGEPVSRWKKPDIPPNDFPIQTPQTPDEFDGNKFGLQWQWNANPKDNWYSFTSDKPGWLRLHTVQNITQNGNLWFVPNLFLQKFSSPSFTATTLMEFNPKSVNDKSGLVIMGKEWSYLSLYQSEEGVRIGMFRGHYDQAVDTTKEIESRAAKKFKDGIYRYYLRVDVDKGGICYFSYSLDGDNFEKLGEGFRAVKGVWIGAKVGLFSLNPNVLPTSGYADFDWFRVD